MTRQYKLNRVPTEDMPAFIARGFARRIKSVPEEDIVQQAELIALVARRDLDPSRGDGRGYIYTAVTRGLMNFTFDASSPVTCRTDRRKLTDVASVELEDWHVGDVGVFDAATQADMWRASVRTRVRELLGDDAATVVACLLAGRPPLEVARELGAPLGSVLEALVAAKAAIESDDELRQLWRDVP